MHLQEAELKSLRTATSTLCVCVLMYVYVYRNMYHCTTATGTQLLLYQLQSGLAVMASFAAPLFRAAAG